MRYPNECLECGAPLPVAKVEGRPRSFDTNACRQRHYRRARKFFAANPLVVDPIPAELRNLPRWVRHSAKRPIAVGGWGVSVHDTKAFATYPEVLSSTVGDGIGFVLNGDGIVCIDLDDCVDGGVVNPVAARFVQQLGDTYSEFSPSGRGLHVWGYSDLAKGRRFTVGGLKVEAYPAGRFITVTGKPYRPGKLDVLYFESAVYKLA